MEPFMAVLEDLECKIFFVAQPWLSTFLRSGEEGTGGEMKGGGTDSMKKLYRALYTWHGRLHETNEKFLPSLLQAIITEQDRKLYFLPLRLGELAIPILS